MITDERVDRSHLQEVFGREIGDSPYAGFWSIRVGGDDVAFRLDGLGYGTEGMLKIIAQGGQQHGYHRIPLEGAAMWFVELPADAYRVVLDPQPTTHADVAERVERMPVVTVCRTPVDQALVGAFYGALIEGVPHE